MSVMIERGLPGVGMEIKNHSDPLLRVWLLCRARDTFGITPEELCLALDDIDADLGRSDHTGSIRCGEASCDRIVRRVD